MMKMINNVNIDHHKALTLLNSPLFSSILILSFFLGGMLLSGCRTSSGPNDYASQEIFMDASMPLEDALEEGEERLSLGVFYEGEFTENYPVDDVNAHFYIYEETFSMVEINQDRIEGEVCDQIRHEGKGWWGGGVHWNTSKDLSRWSTLHISLKSSASDYQKLELAMNNSDSERALLKVSDYGFSTDGQWHSLEIPLSDFVQAGLNLEQVLAPLVFVGLSGNEGDLLWIDGVYLSHFQTPN